MTSGLRSQELFSPLAVQGGIEACIRDLNEYHQILNEASEEAVRKDRDYRKATAEAFLRTSEGTQEARKQEAALKTADQRFEAHLAESRKESALEKVRSLRAELQSWQALAYMIRSEMSLAR